MRKQKYIKQVAVMLDEEYYQLLIEVTDKQEVSVSEFIRSIVEERLNRSRCAKTIYELTTVEKLQSFILELQDYLKPKLEPVYDENGKGDPYWTCGQDHFLPTVDDMFSNFKEFCRLKKLDHEVIKEMIEKYSSEMHNCECNYVNNVYV